MAAFNMKINLSQNKWKLIFSNWLIPLSSNPDGHIVVDLKKIMVKIPFPEQNNKNENDNIILSFLW